MLQSDVEIAHEAAGNLQEVNSDERFYVVNLLKIAGLTVASENKVKRISGGVSSDVWLVSINTGGKIDQYVVKQPLEKLRVEKNWKAPLRRAKFEYLWLRLAAEKIPGKVPHVIFFDENKPFLITQYISGDNVQCWQKQLFSGIINYSYGSKVGCFIARMHSRTACDAGYAEQFNSADILKATRIEPYFLSLLEVYPELEKKLHELGESVFSHSLVVIHGDLSPKNILCRDDKPIFLDAECACYADPAFDLAFLLNHLILKYFHFNDERFLVLLRVITTSYLREVTWESKAMLERRVARLLPFMMLARVDGKSTLYYLRGNEKEVIRNMALKWIDGEKPTIDLMLRDL